MSGKGVTIIMERTAPKPRPTRRALHQARSEPSVVEHFSILKAAIVFGSVTIRLLAIMPMA